MSIEECYDEDLSSFSDLGSIESQVQKLSGNRRTYHDIIDYKESQSKGLEDISMNNNTGFLSSDKEDQKFKQAFSSDIKIFQDSTEPKIKDDETSYINNLKILGKKSQKQSLNTDQTINTIDEANRNPQGNKKRMNRILNAQVCLRVEQMMKEGMSFKQIGEKLGISQRSINKLQDQYQLYGRLIPENGSICNARLMLEKQKQFQASQEIIKNVITKDCSITLKDMQRALKQKGISKSRSTIHAYLAKMKISRKKLQKIPLQRNSSSKIEYRKNYCKMIQQIPLSKQVFMDETIFGLQTTGHYGWAPKGEQPKTYVSASRRKHITLLAAVSMRGFQATKLVKGPVTSKHICQFLQHYLDHLEQDQILVMDNARMHHAAIVKEKIKALNRQVRYIPAYSPQLNPIENIFSEIKVHYIKLKKDSDIKGQDMARLIQDAIKNMRSKEFSKYYQHYWQWLQKGAAGELFL